MASIQIPFNGGYILTKVTHEPRDVVEWIDEIHYIHRRRLNRLIVGVDAEWRPIFSKHQRSPVATLQLCVGRRCLIFQLLYCSRIPSSLFSFLANPAYTFVGVGIDGDLDKLYDDYGLRVTNAVDLRTQAASIFKNRSLRSVGLKDLCRTYLRVEMEKPKRVTMSRWDQQELTEEQVKYACIDAYVSFEIGILLNVLDCAFSGGLLS